MSGYPVSGYPMPCVCDKPPPADPALLSRLDRISTLMEQMISFHGVSAWEFTKQPHTPPPQRTVPAPWPHPTSYICAYLAHESGGWERWPTNIQAPTMQELSDRAPRQQYYTTADGAKFHGVRYSDNAIWDAWNGWRPRA